MGRKKDYSRLIKNTEGLITMLRRWNQQKASLCIDNTDTVFELYNWKLELERFRIIKNSSREWYKKKNLRIS